MFVKVIRNVHCRIMKSELASLDISSINFASITLLKSGILSISNILIGYNILS